MKLTKGIILLHLCILTVLSCFSTVSAEDSAVDMTYATKLHKLGLIDELPEETVMNSGITKLQFSVLTADFLDTDRFVKISYENKIFSDSNRFLEGYPELYSLYECGIIEGDGAGGFGGDQPADAGFMATLLLRGLGYKNLAELNGGFPGGYMSIANDAKLFKGIDQSKALTYADAYRIIANAAETDVYAVTGSNGTGIEYEQTEPYILSACDIQVENGLLEENKFSGILKPLDVISDSIMIDGKAFTYNGDEYNKYIGVNVKYYYKEINGIEYLLYAEPYNKNYREVNISGEDYCDFDGEKISFYEGSKERNFKISKTPFVFYNEVTFTDFSMVTTILKNADTIILRDDDGDNIFDVISVTEYKYGIVNAAAKEENKLWLKNGEILQLSDDDIVRAYNSEGALISLNELPGESIISYTKSLNQSGAEVLIVYNDGLKLEAVITGIRDDEVEADNKLYKIDSAVTGIKAGQRYTLYIGRGNKIFYCELGIGSDLFGVMMNSWCDENEMLIGAKIFTENNQFVKYDFSDSFRINGDVYKKGEADKIKLKFSEFTKDMLIAYKLDNEQKIKELYTAGTDESHSFKKIWERANYHGTDQNVLEKEVVILPETVIFRVPGTTYSGEEQRYSIQSRVVPGNASAYIFGDYTIPQADAVLVQADGAAEREIGTYSGSDWMVVSDISQKWIDDEMRTVYSGWSSEGKNTELILENDDMLTTISRGGTGNNLYGLGPIGLGDVVVYSKEPATNRVDYYWVLYSADKSNTRTFLNIGVHECRGISASLGYNFAYGEVSYYDGTYFITETYNNGVLKEMIDTIDNPDVIVYYADSGKSEAGALEDISIEDKVFYYEYHGIIRKLIIVKDES